MLLASTLGLCKHGAAQIYLRLIGRNHGETLNEVAYKIKQLQEKKKKKERTEQNKIYRILVSQYLFPFEKPFFELSYRI